MVKLTLKKVFCIAFVVGVLAAANAVFLASDNVYAFSYAKRELPVYSVDRNDKLLSISFDCAWGVDYTDELLYQMEKFGVKCTFFAVKFWVEKYPEYCKKIVGGGHELQTHSATHPHMSKMSAQAIRAELESSSSAIEAVTGKKVTLFRCPFGEYNDTVIKTARETGLQVVQWDVDSLDWKDISAKEIAERVLAKAKSGSIILCHNNGLHTAEALPLIFSALTDGGYKFVPISELLIKGDYALRPDGTQYAP